MSALTLESFLGTEIEKITANSYDTHIYRIYLGGGRYHSQTMPLQLRDQHPTWWAEHSGLKAYLDATTIAQYHFDDDPTIFAKFVTVLASTFSVPDNKKQILAQAFLEAVGKIHRDLIEMELAFRGKDEVLH